MISANVSIELTIGDINVNLSKADAELLYSVLYKALDKGSYFTTTNTPTIVSPTTTPYIARTPQIGEIKFQ